MSESKTERFQLVFSGKIKEGFSREQVQTYLAGLRRPTPEKIDYLFSGETHVLEDSHNLEATRKYYALLDRAGAICRLQKVTPIENSPHSESQNSRASSLASKMDKQADPIEKEQDASREKTPEPDSTNQEVPEKPKKQLKGVGGWLEFFGIMVLLISPAYAFYTLNGLYQSISYQKDSTTHLILFLNIAIMGAVTIWGMVIGYKILQGKKTGKKLAQGFLWIRMIVGIFLAAITYFVFSIKFPSIAKYANLMELSISDAMGYFVSSSIWLNYFDKSKRVRNTYG